MQKLFIKNRHDQKIAVVVNETPEAKGLVFIEHGLGGFKEQPHIQVLAEEFKKQGYTTVLFDTANSIGESDGKYEEATLGGSYEDLQDVIAWGKTENWYTEPFALSGHSMGGYSVIQFAEDNPDKVNNIVAWAPVVSGELNRRTEKAEELEEWEKTGWRLRISNSKPGIELRLPWSHMQERLNHNLLTKAGNLNMPIMIIVGDQDIPCPPEHQKLLFDAIPGNLKKLVIIKDAPHTFREEQHIRQLREELNNWFNEQK